ncbi:MAG TPA: O-antigen ligase family protein [Candidatus Paceibacterota bacterium]
MQDGTVKQITRWVALVALFLLPFTPLVVANSYFFPFISGKAFYLRILIEIAVVAWIVLALLDKEYRPRFSWIGASVVGFVLWMFIADAFALNAMKAFWSNFERMEGWVLLVHLLGLFFAASAVLRVEKKWRAWFLMSAVVAIILIWHALQQLAGNLPIHQGSTRIDASFGNSTYLAIYLLFSTFVALWLALTEKYSWLKWSLITLAAVEATLIFFTETRGTIIGLVLALALAAFLTAITAGKRARGWAASALVLILIFVGGIYLARNSDFVQNNHTLERISSISLSDGQTRFTIWGMAFKGILERPLTGYGQEGFNYVFNKFYDPSLYAQEQWFDRAHNAFIDWLSAGGIPAFLLYLSLFGSAIVLLWKSSELSRPERIALTAALVGYAVHNLFVFDNLYSYIYFFAILALIDSQVSRPVERIEKAAVLSAEDGTIYALPISVVFLSAIIWFVNVPGMSTASNLIIAMKPNDTGVSSNIAAFENLAKNSNFAAQEVREQIVSFAGAIVQSSSVTNEQKQRAVSLAVSEMQKQVVSYPLDARAHLQLSYVYRLAGNADEALKEIKIASELSPKKEGFWIEMGIIEFNKGNVKEAQKAFNTAYVLGPQFSDLATYAAEGSIVAGDFSYARQIMLGEYGAVPNVGAKLWFALAAAYYRAGDKANAIKTVNTAIEKYPNAAAEGAAILKQI